MDKDEVNKNLSYIECHVTPQDIELICKYASTVKIDEIMVDLGTAFGKSCGAMAMIEPNVKVYTLDIEESPLKLKTIPPNLIFLRGDSRDYPWDKEIAYLNDDCGSHMYEETKTNIEHWIPHVKKGGYVTFHDYLNFPEFEVKYVVDDYVKKGLFDFIEIGGCSCAVQVV